MVVVVVVVNPDLVLVELVEVVLERLVLQTVGQLVEAGLFELELVEPVELEPVGLFLNYRLLVVEMDQSWPQQLCYPS